MPEKWGFKDRRIAEILTKVADERRGEVKYKTSSGLSNPDTFSSVSVIVHLDKTLPAATYDTATGVLTLGEVLCYVYRRNNAADEICSQVPDFQPESKVLWPDRDEFGGCNTRRVYNSTRVEYPACSFVECVVDNHGDLYVSGPALETSLTTTTSHPTGLPECSGQCKWIWDYTNQEWNLDTNQCSTTTTTTPDPNTTTTSTTLPPCVCGNPSFTTGTTLPPTEPDCDCAEPQFCGVEDQDCTWTNCVDQNYQQPLQPIDCTTSTTTTTTTTSEPTTTTTTTTCPCTTTTTTTTSEGCSGGCNFWSAGHFWQKITDDCDDICPCDYPSGSALNICYEVVMPCKQPTTTTTTTSVPCHGHCDFFYGPASEGGFTWYKYEDTCTADLRSLCRCPIPDHPGDECGTERTYCVSYTTTTSTTSEPTTTTTTTTGDPCCSTTTTTPNPCDEEVCVWRWSVAEADWVQVRSDCGNDCSCYPPSQNGAEDCELKETSCDTAPTSTTTTSTTPCPSDNPCQPYYGTPGHVCNCQCTYHCPQGVWVLVGVGPGCGPTACSNVNPVAGFPCEVQPGCIFSFVACDTCDLFATTSTSTSSTSTTVTT